jgi:hypothetical protein
LRRKLKIQISKEEAAEIVREIFRKSLIEDIGWKTSRDGDAFAAFEELIEKGCDPTFLISRLGIVASAYDLDTWNGMTGFVGVRERKSALKRMRECASDLEKILGGVFGKAWFHSATDAGLPARLRDIANRIEEAARVVTPRTNMSSRAARADLVLHVESRTGGPCDRLLAAVLRPTFTECDAQNQKQWRLDNVHILVGLRLRKDERT